MGVFESDSHSVAQTLNLQQSPGSAFQVLRLQIGVTVEFQKALLKAGVGGPHTHTGWGGDGETNRKLLDFFR